MPTTMLTKLSWYYTACLKSVSTHSGANVNVEYSVNTKYGYPSNKSDKIRKIIIKIFIANLKVQ